ncbi:hypothetical protein HPB47_023204, partial [Ixodes persulcatus]
MWTKNGFEKHFLNDSFGVEYSVCDRLRFQSDVIAVKDRLEGLISAAIPDRSLDGFVVTLLGDATVPPEAKKVLEHGPKFCTQPRLNPIEKIAIVRSLADHVVPEEKERCLSEAVDAIRLRTTVQRSGRRISCVVSYLQENNLKLLTRDKKGGFVVLPQGLYDEKSSKAITKNFRQVDVSLQKIKKKAVEICERLELSNLARRVKGAKKLNLDVFFTAKTHKVECPLRTIVTESLSWQKETCSGRHWAPGGGVVGPIRRGPGFELAPSHPSLFQDIATEASSWTLFTCPVLRSRGLEPGTVPGVESEHFLAQ